MSLKLHNLRIGYIIAFDLELSNETELKYHLFKKCNFFGQNPSFELKSLSSDIYEKEFIRLYPKIPTFKVDLSGIELFRVFHNEIEKKFIENEIEDEILFLPCIQDCIDKITLTFSFDQCNICSAILDFSFNFDKSLEPHTIIRISEDLCCFTDEVFFPFYFKPKIEFILGVPQDSLRLMEEHATYPVICSTETNNFIKQYNKHELFGIMWMEKSYKSFSKKIVNEVIKNDIAPYKGDILGIATVASFIVFKDTDLYGDYVNERINAIEIFCRQKYLLKKLDLKLDFLIRKYNMDINNLKSAITEIRRTQTYIQSSLEFYRNTKISATHSFDILFGTLNKVFELDKYYKVVNEKSNACENLYRSLHEERRNQLAENIQLIVIFLGTSSLLVAIYSFCKCSFLACIIISIFIVLLLIVQIKYPGKIKNIILKFVYFIIK